MGSDEVRNLLRMGSIGIVWEYLIQDDNTKTGMVTKLPIQNSLTKQCSEQIMSTRSTRVPLIHDAKCYRYKLITCKGGYVQKWGNKACQVQDLTCSISTNIGYTTVLRKGKHAKILS